MHLGARNNFNFLAHLISRDISGLRVCSVQHDGKKGDILDQWLTLIDIDCRVYTQCWVLVRFASFVGYDWSGLCDLENLWNFLFYFLVNVWKAAGFSLIWHLISVVILESMSCQKKTVINTCKNVIATLCYNVFFKQGKIVCLFLYFIVILCASKTVCYTWYICIQRLRCSSSRGAPTSSIRMSVYARTGIEWWCCSKSFFGRT